jgi:hypothetical protein
LGIRIQTVHQQLGNLFWFRVRSGVVKWRSPIPSLTKHCQNPAIAEKKELASQAALVLQQLLPKTERLTAQTGQDLQIG